MKKVAIIYFSKEQKKKIVTSIVSGIQKGLDQQGADYVVFNGLNYDLPPLRQFPFLCIGATSDDLLTSSHLGKIGKKIESGGDVTSIRSFAFITKGGLAKQRKLLDLMKILEFTGLKVINSEYIKDAHQAELIGRDLKLRL